MPGRNHHDEPTKERGDEPKCLREIIEVAQRLLLWAFGRGSRCRARGGHIFNERHGHNEAFRWYIGPLKPISKSVRAFAMTRMTVRSAYTARAQLLPMLSAPVVTYLDRGLVNGAHIGDSRLGFAVRMDQSQWWAGRPLEL